MPTEETMQALNVSATGLMHKTSSASSHNEADSNVQQETLMKQYANTFEEMIDRIRHSDDGLCKKFVAKLIKHIAAKGVPEIAEMMEKWEAKVAQQKKLSTAKVEI
ncbi:hypothetical protein LPJ64_003889 [Coemansia asiatica]|uniref:Uncharacterized protein n=1 Tax=Coemansia asiatica TaxID=1052880 RepID=A0A9W8CID2_9FUNG|nr:hypothetical protein LPJ64_003889 [Coemansia asiatica]